MTGTHKPGLRMHKKGSPSVSSVTFIGESYWRSRTANLVSLEVANQTPKIIKRGFEYMYHKSNGYRLTGGSLYFGAVPDLVRKSQHDHLPPGIISAYLEPDAVPPLPSTSIPPDPREKYDSAKKVIKAATLISLEEAQQREASRRDRAAGRAREKEIKIECEVSRLKREVAAIAWKKAQAKRKEEEGTTCLETESQGKKTLETKRRKEEPTLAAAVAAREDGLVVAPTGWIVPLLSLDEARHAEKVKRDATATKPPAPLPLLPPSVVASVDSLMVNTGNGNTAPLELISLEEARERDKARRLEENVTRSRARVLGQAGTGSDYVSLVTPAGTRKQDALPKRNGSSQSEGRRSMPKLRKPSHPSPSHSDVNQRSPPEDELTPQEKARLQVMSSAGDWTGPDDISGYSYYAHCDKGYL